MLQDEHNRLVQEWILNEYIVHKCDIIDKLSTVIRLNRSDYHPTRHDNVMVDLFPIKIKYQLNHHVYSQGHLLYNLLEYPDVNINRNQILLDV